MLHHLYWKWCHLATFNSHIPIPLSGPLRWLKVRSSWDLVLQLPRSESMCCKIPGLFTKVKLVYHRAVPSRLPWYTLWSSQPMPLVRDYYTYYPFRSETYFGLTSRLGNRVEQVTTPAFKYTTKRWTADYNAVQFNRCINFFCSHLNPGVESSKNKIHLDACFSEKVDTNLETTWRSLLTLVLTTSKCRKLDIIERLKNTDIHQ